MTPPLFEAVPNFSEGRDLEKVDRIAASARAVPYARVLDLHSDPDHNRSVLTLVGPEAPLIEACLALARACVREIDLRQHSGAHPRIGALDVLPFVPLSEATLEDAIRLAHLTGAEIGTLGVPVYLYEEAASATHRRDLAEVRRAVSMFGGGKGNPLWQPDFGPRQIQPDAGAVAVGARRFLVAFNAYLDTADVAVAQAVASEVRGRDGGLPALKAIGLLVAGQAQVSMNLTDLSRTPLPAVIEAVRASAARRGAMVTHTELVGLAPLDAILEVARDSLSLPELEPRHVIEAALWSDVRQR